MKRIAAALSVLTVLVLAVPAGAELCEKCKGKMFIMSVGKCVECGKTATSGAFKLCPECSARLGQCERCRAPLKTAKRQAVEKPTTQPAKIDTKKSGTYTSGKWKYRYAVLVAHYMVGGDSRACSGLLTYDGKPVADNIRVRDRVKTPWGMMVCKSVPSGKMELVSLPPAGPAGVAGTRIVNYGWHLVQPAGRLLPSPGKALSKPAKIDMCRPGTYTFGKWRYDQDFKRYHPTINCSSGRVATNRLRYDGKAVADNIKKWDRIKTPWGMMIFVRGTATAGWEPIESAAGRLLPSPEKAAPAYLAPLKLDESSNGKTVSVFVGQEIIIRLKGNATTGYSWVAGKNEGDALGQVGKVKYVSDQPPMPAGGGGRGLMRHRVGGGGKYVFTFTAKKAGKAKLTLEYKRGWEKNKPPHKTFTLNVNVKADRTAERVKALKDNLDKFTLDVIYFGAGLSKAQECVYDLTLTATDFVRGYPSLRLKARISKNQALMIIDHLAKEGFLSDAREIGGKISLAAPREQTYRFFAGPTSVGEKFFFADIGWDLKMLNRLAGLRKVLDGDAAKAMDKLLKRLEGQRKKWEKKTPVKKS